MVLKESRFKGYLSGARPVGLEIAMGDGDEARDGKGRKLLTQEGFIRNKEG